MGDTPVLQAERMEALIREYGNMLFRFCLVTLGNAGDAEDAVQETYIRYLRKRPVFNDSEHEKAWLLRVAGNLCRDILRQRNRHPNVDIDEISQFISDDRGPHRQDTQILDALMNVPEKYRTVLVLYYVEEYSTEMIAKMIGRTASAVKMRLKKGRTLLREAYRREME